MFKGGECMNIIWNGDSGLANKLFGESYGIDWIYIENSSSIVLKCGKVLNIGDSIK